jgi:cysteine-rich repeat protein
VTVSSAVDSGSGDATDVGESGSLCGDGVVDPGEECDDGDDVDADECSNACTKPPCGDGRVQPGEDCDLGAANDDHGTCRSDCSAAICGDGFVLWGLEECDGEDLDGLDCTAFGYPDGELVCDPSCRLDLSGCNICPNGEPCEPYAQCKGFCADGSTCWSETGAIGTCLPPCFEALDCPFVEMAELVDCVDNMCVILCANECPLGMTCQPTQLMPGLVCLW